MPGVRPAPWLIAAALALAWFALAPPTPDLAAQVYRAGLFRSDGFTLFNANWYGGHHTPAYSILFPPLGALLGVRVVGVLAAVASAVLFERIARRHFGDSARWGALWFGAGTVADLLIGRLTFAVGVAFALAAVYALQRGQRRSGLALGICCTLASPVAGLFLALAGVAHALAVRERLGLWLAAAATIPAVTLAVLFPLFRTDAAARLSPERYRRWLDREGVRYVALPDVALDPTGRAEGALIRRGLPYLRMVHRNRHWAIYEVLGTPGLSEGVGRLTKVAPQSFDVRVRRPGFTLVRVRYTPYWRIARGRGCVMRSAAGWTLVYALSTGPLRVDAAFDPRRLITRKARCTAAPQSGGTRL